MLWKRKSNKDLIDWIKETQDRGCGEILFL